MLEFVAKVGVLSKIHVKAGNISRNRCLNA